MNVINTKNRYGLVLADGVSWRLCFDDSLASWVHSLAKVMKLGPCCMDQPNHKLHFIPRGSAEPYSSEKERLDMYVSGKVFNIWHHGDPTALFAEIDMRIMDAHKNISIINMGNALKPLYRHYTQKGGGPMHAAFAGLNGKGFLISAKGNTGKSTCIERLPDYYEKLCDDTALTVKTSKNNYCVHPMPTWSDYFMERRASTFDVQYHLPLRAIFFLEQSEKDEVVPLTGKDASLRIFEGFKQSWSAFWNRMDDDIRKQRTEQVFNNSIELAKSIPCFQLKATLHGRFWDEIEKVLSRGGL